MRAFTFCYRRGVAIADNAQSCAKADDPAIEARRTTGLIWSPSLKDLIFDMDRSLQGTIFLAAAFSCVLF